jgi:hypothetical protein
MPLDDAGCNGNRDAGVSLYEDKGSGKFNRLNGIPTKSGRIEPPLEKNDEVTEIKVKQE